MRVLSAGDSALLIELDDIEAVLGLSAALRADPLDGVLEAVPAARTVLLLCDPNLASLHAVAQAVRRIRTSAARARLDEVVEIPVTYDGQDIDEVLELTGLTRRGLIDWHIGSEWQVAFCGFAPGFGYLVTDDPLSIPRKDTPRTRVPPGSVGLAGEFTGIYPSASPGGWQLIGRTDVTLFDISANPPALLRPGIQVRFLEQM
ncbi:MAG: allophanate hydrolase subunit 1 [Geodermatophilaceae bacterium]|nr:allophanate hydrolase subunit 1 [Geodermatophilaceae bacterium]